MTCVSPPNWDIEVNLCVLSPKQIQRQSLPFKRPIPSLLERERQRGRQQQKTAAKASAKMIIPVRCFTCGKVPYTILILTFIVIIISMTVTVMGFCF